MESETPMPCPPGTPSSGHMRRTNAQRPDRNAGAYKPDEDHKSDGAERWELFFLAKGANKPR